MKTEFISKADDGRRRESAQTRYVVSSENWSSGLGGLARRRFRTISRESLGPTGSPDPEGPIIVTPISVAVICMEIRSRMMRHSAMDCAVYDYGTYPIVRHNIGQLSREHVQKSHLNQYKMMRSSKGGHAARSFGKICYKMI
jgi:hypothetical protein